MHSARREWGAGKVTGYLQTVYTQGCTAGPEGYTSFVVSFLCTESDPGYAKPRRCRVCNKGSVLCTESDPDLKLDDTQSMVQAGLRHIAIQFNGNNFFCTGSLRPSVVGHVWLHAAHV